MVTVRPNFQDSIHVGYVAGLKKFAEYFTSVLCFTTPGDGPRSPPQLVHTHEDGTWSPVVLASPRVSPGAWSIPPPPGMGGHTPRSAPGSAEGMLAWLQVPCSGLGANSWGFLGSAWPRGAPQLQRHPGHIPEGQLAGARGEERHPDG